MGKRRMLGLCFISPAMVTVIAMTDPKARVFLVNDDTTKRTIREQINSKLTGSKKEKTFVIAGIRNLHKLGPKPQKVHAIVCDVPQLLCEFPKEIRIGDAKKVGGDKWKDVRMDREKLGKRIRWSAYTKPIHPKRIAKVRSSYTTQLPDPSKKFDPKEGIERLIQSVEETAREPLKLGLYRFLAGLTDRRKFATVRRKAFNRVLDRDEGQNLNDFKTLFSTVQCWIETDGDGRAVSDAYQMCAKKKKMKPAIAAGRAGANLEILIQLMRVIPPSRRQEFKGYTWNPRKG